MGATESYKGHQLESKCALFRVKTCAWKVMMFCREGCRCLRRLSTLHRPAKRTLTPPITNYSRRTISCSQALLCSSSQPPSPPAIDDVANLDTVPSWSVDPRTQLFRPGSNWTYEKELFALARRIGYDLKDLPRLQTALTHRSVAVQPSSTLVENQTEDNAPVEHNSRLSFLGRNLVQYFVGEHLLSAYPNMEAESMADISKFLLNDTALVKCSDYIGITELIQSKCKIGDPKLQKIIVRALFATLSCLHLDRGPAAARKFVVEFITSKMAGVDLHEVINLQHPRYILRSILASQGLPRAESRLLKETGRATHFPTFVVGVYSGERLLGEGCGTSLKRAEREAIVAALHQHLSTQLASLTLPPEGYEKEGDIDFFQPISTEESDTEQNAE